MLLTEYLSELSKTIDEYSKTGLIISSELKIDARTEKIGLIKAATTFSDESKLFVTEYLDLRYKTEKLSYSFHLKILQIPPYPPFLKGGWGDYFHPPLCPEGT